MPPIGNARTMRIQSIAADNFKSLIDFRLDLAKFTCLIGLNGVGKSTVLQFIDFLAQQVRGELRGWLEERHWRSKEVLSRLTTDRTVTFQVTVQGPRQRETVWSGVFNPYRLQCTAESLKSPEAELEVQSASYSIKDRLIPGAKAHIAGKIPFTYEGSILSQLREDVLPESLQQFKEFFLRTESLDLLAPEQLRQRTRSANGSLGSGGRRLSSFLFELGPAGRVALAAKLKRAHKQLNHVYARSGRAGWKQIQVSEMFGTTKLWTEARHVNDGLLRQIAILAELASRNEFLLFDEIENGISPELVEFILDALTTARQQVVVTTHSPMILNYLEDEVARAGVIYLYKTKHGHTQSIPFFSIPSIAEKLTVMGPGEAFVDTNLMTLGDEIRILRAGG
jgi:predicted ATPase